MNMHRFPRPEPAPAIDRTKLSQAIHAAVVHEPPVDHRHNAQVLSPTEQLARINTIIQQRDQALMQCAMQAGEIARLNECLTTMQQEMQRSQMLREELEAQLKAATVVVEGDPAPIEQVASRDMPNIEWVPNHLVEGRPAYTQAAANATLCDENI